MRKEDHEYQARKLLDYVGRGRTTDEWFTSKEFSAEEKQGVLRAYRKLQEAERPPAPDELVIVVDSREQSPYRFENSVVKGLKTGDYSILNLEDRVAIERKSLSDLFSSLAGQRQRFERELRRLSLLDYGAIVVEGNLTDVLSRQPHSRMDPRSAAMSLVGWSAKYSVPVWLCGSRGHGNSVTYHALRLFHRYYREGRYEN